MQYCPKRYTIKYIVIGYNTSGKEYNFVKVIVVLWIHIFAAR